MKKTRLLTMTLAILFIGSLCSSSYAGSYTFDIIDLGTVGTDTASYARSINNSTTIVGDSISSDGKSTAYVWSQWQNNAQMQGLAGKNKNNSTYATTIDSSGIILGATLKGNKEKNEAGTWRSYEANEKMDKLGGKMTYAYNMNDNGQILATNGDASETHVYSIWGGHDPVKVGGDMDIKYASDINEGGQVIGETALGTPYIWNMYNDTTEEISSIDGSATDINKSGTVVGTKRGDRTASGEIIDSGTDQAYIYENGAVVELGFVGTGNSSEAYAINEDGIVVGTSNGNAFVWAADSGMLNLNDLLPDGSDWTNLSVASDINDLGQIVGWGTINGETHSFLISEIVAAPEPKVIFIFLLVAVVVLFRVFQGSGAKA